MQKALDWVKQRRNVWVLFTKELSGYFNSPIAYIVIIVFSLICGWFFASNIFIGGVVTISNYLNVVPLIFTFFIPAITMRLFAEEVRSGTIEVLTTLPVKDYEIILGKYLSAVALIAIGILMTLIHPLTLSILGKVDAGQIIGSYKGLFLMGAMFASIGLFSSVITKHQIVAFIAGFVICFAFFMIRNSLDYIPAGLIPLFEYIGIGSHFENIAKGVIDSRDVIYYLSVISIFYILTLSAFSSRRWK